MERLSRFWSAYARGYWRSYALGFLFLLATNGLAVAIPALLERAIDALAAQERALSWAAAILLAGLSLVFVRTFSRILFFNPGRTIEYEVKRRLFSHLLTLPRSFFEAMSPGEIITRGTTDTASLRALIGFGSLQLFNVIVALALTLGRMIWLSPSLSLYCLPPLVFAALILRWSIRRLFHFQRALLEQTARLSDTVLEGYGGAAVLQAFSAGGGFLDRFDRENQRYLKIGEGMQWIVVWGLPVVSVVGSGCVVLCLWLGAPQVVAGTLSPGQLTSFVVYINLLVSTLTSLGWFTSAIQRGYLSLGRIFELFDAEAGRPTERAGDEPLPSAEGRGRRLELRGLSFTYPGAERPALEGINLKVEAGELVGIFGLTGSGKSTLLDLIARIREPEPGQLWVDGVDVTRCSTEAYWGALGYAQQSPFLFSEKLIQNITMSADEPAPARLQAALEDAALDGELASFAEGLDTLVGERGVTLSGGQRQRVSLARAFYRGALPLLLLDDVMSAVDHRTEKRLIEGIRQRASERTTLIVSHRMSVLQHADRVLVLDEGRPIAEGRHEELLQRPGIYAEAWRAQQQDTLGGEEIGESRAEGEERGDEE